jgi:beta-lactamase class A
MLRITPELLAPTNIREQKTFLRRDWLKASAASTLMGVLTGCGAPNATQAEPRHGGSQSVGSKPQEDAPVGSRVHSLAIDRALLELRAVERRLGGALGLAAHDIQSGAVIHYHAEQRFPMCSTFKWLLAAAVLARVDGQLEQLERPLKFDASAVLEYAPVAREFIGRGYLTVEEACRASVEVSDNTAANLLLETIGGPVGLTNFLRSLGDHTSRLDRSEPMLNTALEGDERDTTTPAAMLSCANAVLLGRVLGDPSLELLRSWMIASPTGKKRLRAGLPADYLTGDKTGTGENGATGDVAFTIPPHGKAILIAAYARGSKQGLEVRNAAFAEMAAIVARTFLPAAGPASAG